LFVTITLVHSLRNVEVYPYGTASCTIPVPVPVL
jgi:hypothetical protein